jgi:hypothetical protein
VIAAGGCGPWREPATALTNRPGVAIVQADQPGRPIQGLLGHPGPGLGPGPQAWRRADGTASSSSAGRRSAITVPVALSAACTRCAVAPALMVSGVWLL